MLTEQEYVSGPEENYQWYENDPPSSPVGGPVWSEVFRDDNFCDGSCQHNLQLAAELGKTLLERNKDLENQLRLAHQSSYDQQREIDLLTKQLEALRGVSDSRMRIYEEVDRNLQDAEKRNENLKKEARGAKAKVDELSGVVETQEARLEELTLKIETLHQREHQSRSRSSRRTQSVPSLADPDERSWRSGGAGFEDFRGFPTEGHERISAKEMKGLRTLQESIRNLKQQLTTEARKRSDVESDMAEIVRENETLQVRVTLLEQEEKKIKKLESELEEVTMRAEKMCAQCGKSLETTRLMKKPEMSVEHDDLQEIPNGEFIRLKNGGSAYGSRESLNTLGLELETPIDEQLVTIFNAKMNETSPVDIGQDEEPDRRSFATSPGEERCGSLLGELEDQYRNLVKKYEALIEAKSKRAESSDAATQEDGNAGGTPNKAELPNKKRPSALPIKNKDTQASTSSASAKSDDVSDSINAIPSTIDFTSPVDPTVGRFENGPPEYKRLFKEIFETLRRSCGEDDDLRYVQEAELPKKSSKKTTGKKA